MFARHRLFAALLISLTVTVLVLSQLPLAAAESCSGSGPYTVTWDGGGSTNRWHDGDNWNPNGEPGRLGEPVDDRVCIPASASVVMPARVGVESHLISIDSEGTLTVGEGNKLFLHGEDPSYMTTFRLRAGTLGGEGTVTISEVFEWTSLTTGAATQTTRPLEQISATDPLTTAPGKTIIGPTARLDINGPLGHPYDPSANDGLFGCGAAPCGGVNLRDKRVIENHGITSLTQGGFVAADWGTTFYNMPLGNFVIRNDRGYYQGFSEPESMRSRFVNHGVITKAATSEADGPGRASVFDAEYEELDEAEVRVHAGSLEILTGLGSRRARVASGAAIGTGACAAGTTFCGRPSPTRSDKEITTVETSGFSETVVIRVVEEGLAASSGTTLSARDARAGLVESTAVGEKVTVTVTPRISKRFAPITLIFSIDGSELEGIDSARSVRLRREGNRIPRCEGSADQVSPKPACLVWRRLDDSGDFRAKALTTEGSLRDGSIFTARRYK